MLFHWNKRVCLLYGLLFTVFVPLQAKKDKSYWQQEISYKMEVLLDVNTNKLTGRQVIKYKNNSPEILDKVFFHLYFNAFQPGSAMDIRSVQMPDMDPRIGEKISNLQPEDVGYHRILKMTQNGADVEFNIEGTILEVALNQPIKSGQTAKFQMQFESQVPIQIRRSGRDNVEGIRYSMSQWYPKMCEYDARGWHADPYIAREFYGVWGDFDVEITLNAGYTVGASGVLVNSNEIGHGYSSTESRTTGLLTWHFVAKKVHDFVWAADPDYKHDQHKCADGVVLQSFYQPNETYSENWKGLLPIMEEAFKYINTNFGQYPYPVYSFIQGGDAGMEYPMATLITGNRSLTSLVGVSVHELMHSWFQMIFGFNESYYYWMDEGFTNYAAERVMAHLRSKALIPGKPSPNPYESFYTGYKNIVEAGIEEPLSTHADHFESNTAYSTAAYIKGAIFINQMEYIVGEKAFDRGLLAFFDKWKFKHPDDNAFIRSMELTSGLELDWYKDYMVYTTKTIDYGIDTVSSYEQNTSILLERNGFMPMPVDVEIKLKDGQNLFYTIPLDIMRGSKTDFAPDGAPFKVMPDWAWVNPGYELNVPFPLESIKSVTIDPSRRLADLNLENNTWPFPKS